MKRSFSFSGDGYPTTTTAAASQPRRQTDTGDDLALSMSSLSLSSSPTTTVNTTATSAAVVVPSSVAGPNTNRETGRRRVSLAIIGGERDVSGLVSGMGGLRVAGGGEAVFEQLQEVVTAMRAKLAGMDRLVDRVRDERVDGAFGYFAEVDGLARHLCQGLLLVAGGGGGGGGGHSRTGSRSSAGDAEWPAAAAATGQAAAEDREKKRINAQHANLVREWHACLKQLAAALKLWLTNTYKRHEQFATPDFLDALLADRKSRSQVVGRSIKNSGPYKRIQGQSEVWSKWETRLQNYDQVMHELAEITDLLQSVGSGIKPDRAVQETAIAPRGDAMLEFPNTAMDWKPVLRFRVSSHMLTETSPIFARTFCKQADDMDDGPEDGDQLPPPPTPFTCQDGSRVLLYRMPQTELDNEGSLTILLHAAHMHNDRVPRDVSFPQFVALAEASLRYQCTSPLELFVEHRWAPRWMHKAVEDMPDGLVVISYTFGMRRLFTRVTKSAILHLVDEKELAAKEWPAKIKERIWAVRCAKMAQVYGTCIRAVEEYLRPDGGHSATTIVGMEGLKVPESREVVTPVGSPGLASLSNLFYAPTNPPVPGSLTSSSRCPKGSHWCDATNLGWLMLVFNELQILSTFLNPTAVLSGPATAAPPPQSLAQILDALRAMASPPPHPAHQGRFSSSVCDPAPAFRAAINDVYNSVTGLTLYEVDGGRHGWALSRDRISVPQVVLRVDSAMRPGSAQTYAAEFNTGAEPEARGSPPSAADRVFGDDRLCLRILGAADGAADLHALAALNRQAYTVYKQHELALTRNLVRANRTRTNSLPAPTTATATVTAMDIPTHRRQPPPSQSVEHYLRKLIRETEESRARVADRVAVVPEPDSGSETGTATPTPTPTPSASPTTPAARPRPRRRSRAPSYSSSSASVRSAGGVNPFFKMTEEEARQILWPEPSPPLSPRLCTPAVRAFAAVDHVLEEREEEEGLGEMEGKFAGQGMVMRVEDKTLVAVGNKQLREDLHRRIGLI